ncbi:MAG: hypothetical protein R2774_01095 [Saprospiraceae bacterium]
MRNQFSSPRKHLQLIGLLTFVFIISTGMLYGQSFGSHFSNGTMGGIGIGSVIAIVASWSRNHSVLWAILHAIMGWFYVIYYVITR